MSTHSESPWTIGKSYTQSKRGTISRTAILSANGNYIVDRIGGDHLDPQETRLNAQLIAAAPDLLEACRAQSYFDYHFASCKDCTKNELCLTGTTLLDNARALRHTALMKAEEAA